MPYMNFGNLGQDHLITPPSPSGAVVGAVPVTAQMVTQTPPALPPASQVVSPAPITLIPTPDVQTSWGQQAIPVPASGATLPLLQTGVPYDHQLPAPTAVPLPPPPSPVGPPDFSTVMPSAGMPGTVLPGGPPLLPGAGPIPVATTIPGTPGAASYVPSSLTPTSQTYSLMIEGNAFGTFASPDQVAQAIATNAKPGDRVQVSAGDQALGVQIMSGNGLIDVPPDIAPQVQQLPPQQVQAAVAAVAPAPGVPAPGVPAPAAPAASGGGIPWWLALIPVGAYVALKK